MASPVVWTGQPIHLDALLAMVASGGRRDFGVSWEPGDDWLPKLPLAQMVHGDEWWYRASAWTPESEETSLVRFSKKWDVENEDLLDCRAARTVTTTNARFKEAWIPVEIVDVKVMQFFAVGDYIHVRQLARRVQQIGKKGSQGYGEVRHCRVSRLGRASDGFDRDWRADARPARNLPLAFCREHGLESRERVAPLRPPYWRRSTNHVTLVGS